MCLGIPGELVELPTDDTDLGLVTVAGVRRRVNLGLLVGESGEHADRDLAVGDWILIHVGFALAKIDEKEAADALAMLRAMGPAYDQELEEFVGSATGREGL